MIFLPLCITCNREIREAIWNDRFFPNLAAMLSAFIVLALIVALLSAIASKRHRQRLSGVAGRPLFSPVPLSNAAMVLGIGIGGFIDGIVLHQVLQWHEMVSNRLPPTTLVAKSVNMFWDGIFHAFSLLVTMVGIVLLWKLLWRTDIDRSGNLLAGGMLTGWGIFNIVEGIIDHHVLKLHNVREITDQPEAWNYGFLGISLLMLIAGAALMRKKHKKV
ncbi:MAG TPA: DUF2243 domain-containing protein [Flavisolibacter sp.]|nr:DUF2243 domain-containing protein [Flavisolibacter sp.]